MQPNADTLTLTEDGRTALRMQRRIPHPPERIWEALTRPELTARWMPVEVRLDPSPGAGAAFRFPDGRRPPTRGTVLEAEEPWVLAYTWESDRLHWSVRPDRAAGAEDGDSGVSLLTLVHTFDDHWGAASFASGWHVCVTALAQLLDGEEPDGAGDRDGALHEAYVELFDLVGSTVEEEPAGVTVRFERQLVRPVETVWSYLTRGTDPLPGQEAPSGFTAIGSPAGAITELDPPRLLEYAWSPLGRVRWQLTEGTGHGARLVLTRSGPAVDEPAVTAVQAAWYQRIGELAGQLLDLPR
ncbi:SRPBCC family protein [Streptomyces sp. NPDC049954]|uniref:SRPBCC family protein n=1 Tax=Streptomyces sp. NPDC049954 TaxID=3155779 RepID=UPI00344705DB